MTRGRGGAVGCYDPERHHRRSIRLRGYDYSQSGAYFVTLVAQDRSCIFGDVVDGVVHLNEAGCMAVESKRPLTQAARELGVSKDTLYGWVRQ